MRINPCLVMVAVCFGASSIAPAASAMPQLGYAPAQQAMAFVSDPDEQDGRAPRFDVGSGGARVGAPVLAPAVALGVQSGVPRQRRVGDDVSDLIPGELAGQSGSTIGAPQAAPVGAPAVEDPSRMPPVEELEARYGSRDWPAHWPPRFAPP